MINNYDFHSSMWLADRGYATCACLLQTFVRTTWRLTFSSQILHLEPEHRPVNVNSKLNASRAARLTALLMEETKKAREQYEKSEEFPRIISNRRRSPARRQPIKHVARMSVVTNANKVKDFCVLTTVEHARTMYIKHEDCRATNGH